MEDWKDILYDSMEDKTDRLLEEDVKEMLKYLKELSQSN